MDCLRWRGWINFVVGRRRANHQRLRWRLNADNCVNQPGWETAKLARTDPVSLAVDLDDQCAFQHHETLITAQMQMRLLAATHPALVGVVVPNLEPLRL